MNPSNTLKNFLLTAFIFSSFKLQGSTGILTKDFLNGLYKVNFPIGIIVEDDKCSGYLNKVVLNAINEWEDALEVDIWQTETTLKKNEISILIYWADSLSQENNSTHTLAKIERTYLDGIINKIEIILDEKNQLLSCNKESLLKEVLLHELGHVIGLSHIKNYKSIMSEKIDPTINTLQQIDIVFGKVAINKMLKR